MNIGLWNMMTSAPTQSSAPSQRRNRRAEQLIMVSTMALVAALASEGAAQAQTDAAPAAAPTAPAANAPPQALEEIVVTGAARGEKKFKAAYAITTINEQQVKELAPTGTADLLKTVPGVWVETTGGETNANIYIRGFPQTGNSAYLTLELDGVPLFAPSSISFMDNTNLFRLDDSVDHVETLIGGPGAIWGHGQAGATMNVIQKNGYDNPGGVIEATTGSGSLYRGDFYYGGKIADDWYASVGGFYRTDQGVRDTQFPSDQGGQIEATLTHTFESGGEVEFYGRVLDDSNAFFTDIPMLATGAGSNLKLSGFPGFNPLTATLDGNANRIATIDIGPNGQTTSMDMAQGDGAKLHTFGMTFKKTIGDWDIVNRADYSAGELPNVG